MIQSPAPPERTAQVSASDLKAILRKQTRARAWRMRDFYILLTAALTLMVLFKYVPMYGVLIAFKQHNVAKGIFASPWNDFAWFKQIFGDWFFWRVFRNTIILSLLKLVFAFPAPIILALLFNEVRNAGYKRITQSISYFPNFISRVILGGASSRNCFR